MTQSSSVEAERRAKRNIRLGSLGAALEYYDFVVYLYVATLIGQAFFPADMSPTMRLVQTFGIYSTGLLIRPVAGILIARVADRVGRKRLFILTVVVMSVATLCIGLLPTYDQIGVLAPALLLLLRVAQGCAVGGEIPAAAVFVTEHARPDGVARAGAFQQMTAYSGFLLGAAAAFVAGLVATHLTPDLPSLAWRLPFLVGGLLGVVAIYLRRRIDETPAFVRETIEELLDDCAGRQPDLDRGRDGVHAGLGLRRRPVRLEPDAALGRSVDRGDHGGAAGGPPRPASGLRARHLDPTARGAVGRWDRGLRPGSGLGHLPDRGAADRVLDSKE